MMGIFDVTTADDQSQWSVEAMKDAARQSPGVGPLPLCYPTSSYRDYPDRWHGWHLATDWGDNADQVHGSPQLDQHAKWLGDFFGPWSLEIIHKNMDGTGVYWKNGQQVDGPSYYGQATVDQHAGHDHWAITLAGLSAAATWWHNIAIATGKDEDVIYPGDLNANASAPKLGMATRGVKVWEGVLGANGLLIDMKNTDKNVLRLAINRAQEINGWPMTGIGDKRLFGWLVRPANQK